MVHPKAVIDSSVVIDPSVEIGPYAVIEKGVIIAKNVCIGPYVHIKGNTSIGEGTAIATGAVIGEKPQSIGIKENAGKVIIGRNNVIREYVTIHNPGIAGKTTLLGDNNFLMAFSHIAHDCQLENNIVICNGALIAGHVHIQSNAFISGNVAVHQFVRIGRLAMVGGLSRVNQDVPPFMMVLGDSRVWGINAVGVKRAKFSLDDINQIKKAFSILYRKDLPLKKVAEQLKMLPSEKVREIGAFIDGSQRGICGPKRSSFWEKLFLDYPYFLGTTISAYKSFRRNHSVFE